jgi:predicted transcriptional regulator
MGVGLVFQPRHPPLMRRAQNFDLAIPVAGRAITRASQPSHGDNAFPTLHITIESKENARAAWLTAFRATEAGKPIKARHYLTFRSYEALYETLTPSRVAAIAALAGQGTMTAEAVAERVKQPVETVEVDLTALALCGGIDRAKDGFVFPYEQARIETKLW